MHISILGASGFIGQNLYTCLAQHYDVQTVSLRKPIWKDEVHSSNVIVNLVGKAHDHKGTATEQDFYFANESLAKQVFEAFIKSEAKLFIHISSIAALEEFESKTALTEDAMPHPQSWYGKSKRTAEEWLLQQALPEGKQLIILRPPMVHGPGDKGNLGLLYKLISKGIPYPLSSFNNQRSFISIENLIFCIDQIVQKHTNMPSGIYHVADDTPIATQDIIRIIQEVENKSILQFKIPKMIIVALAKFGDVVPFPLNTKRLNKMTSDLIVSNQKIKQVLGIEQLPKSAEDGIRTTIESFRKKSTNNMGR